MVKVGDIVKTKNSEGRKVVPALITKINKGYGWNEKEIDSVNVLFSDGTYGHRAIGKITETGHCIDIQSVLDSIF
ncbi:hypothetical protein [Parablautia intestinalis]|uniref:hypothetical protein n=1 Tax=Parablautia intestinalis TaxID=2320100 RepID=UPI00259C763A|nr:hypothetical protein [Parablautia intestinalis]